MNDRELLELAAMAAGMLVMPMYDYETKSTSEVLYLTSGREWNPLEDDGDALRLAVKLELEIKREMDELTGEIPVVVVGCVAQPELDDPYAATRRAIVRAAAEIGKGME